MEKQQKQLTISIILLALLTTVIISSLIISASYQQSKNSFYEKANSIYQNLIETTLINKVVLDGFVSLVDNIDEFPNYQTIRNYAQQVQIDYPHIYMLELQQAVYKNDVEDFQQTMKSSGIENYLVKSFSYETDRKWMPLSDKAIYYPLTFMEPQLPEAIDALGLDILSVPFLSRALNDSINHQKVFASKPFELAEGGRAYVLFKALPNNKDVIGSILVNTQALLTYISHNSLGFDISLNYPDYKGSWFTESTKKHAENTFIFGNLHYERSFDDFGQPFILIIERPINLNDLNIYQVFIISLISLLLFSFIYILTKKIIQSKNSLDIANNKLSNMIEIKEQLFINISHELRTPLTLVLSPLERVLAEIGIKDSTRKQLELAKKNGDRLSQLINTVLDLTTIKKENNLSEIIIEDEISRYIKAFHPLFQEKNIKLTYNNQKHIYLRVVDGHFQSILENLLSNALKYTETQGCVDLISEIHDGKYTLKIINQHRGLELNQLQIIFERFERLNQSEDITGYGLGLSYVRDICELYDWDIKCTSKINQSVTFTLTISDFIIMPSNIQASNANIIPSKVPTNISKQHILIVEDNIELQKLMYDELSLFHNVSKASNGEEAFSIAKEIIPDLIVSDIMMSGTSGLELLKLLQNHINTSHIPSILLTAIVDEGTKKEAFSLGAIDFIEKPFSTVQFIQKINNILLKQKQKLLVNDIKDDDIAYLSIQDKKFIERLNKLLKKHYSDPTYTIEQLANDIAMSERQLQRKIKALFNTTPNEHIKSFRLNKAKELLSDGNSTGIVADMVGFNSLSYFSRSFKSHFSITPSQFVKQLQK